MDNELHAKITVRVFKDNKCFGPGIAALLHNIDEYSSLRSAASAMGMAYSKAWTILKNCETSLGFKLLNSSVGGKNGGGAILTENARVMLEAYDEYCMKLREYADELFWEKFSFYTNINKSKTGKEK